MRSEMELLVAERKARTRKAAGDEYAAQKAAENVRVQKLIDREREAHRIHEARCSACGHGILTHAQPPEIGSAANEPNWIENCRLTALKAYDNRTGGYVNCDCSQFMSDDKTVMEYVEGQKKAWRLWCEQNVR